MGDSSEPWEGLSFLTTLLLFRSGSELKDIWTLGCIRQGVRDSAFSSLSLPPKHAGGERSEAERRSGGLLGSILLGALLGGGMGTLKAGHQRSEEMEVPVHQLLCIWG